MFYFCVDILTLMAHHTPILLLLIYTGKRESSVKPFGLNVPTYSVAVGEVQSSLHWCGELALLLHCPGFLQRWFQVSPAGTGC